LPSPRLTVALASSDKTPLLALAAPDGRAERRREKLAAEAYAKDRPVFLERVLD